MGQIQFLIFRLLQSGPFVIDLVRLDILEAADPVVSLVVLQHPTPDGGR